MSRLSVVTRDRACLGFFAEGVMRWTLGTLISQEILEVPPDSDSSGPLGPLSSEKFLFNGLIKVRMDVEEMVRRSRVEREVGSNLSNSVRRYGDTDALVDGRPAALHDWEKSNKERADHRLSMAFPQHDSTITQDQNH